MLARFARLTLGASPAARPSAATTRRLLCTGGYKKWDDVAGKNVHGAVENKVTSDLGGDEADAAAGASADARKSARARTGPGASSAPFWGQTTSSSSRGSFGSTFVSPQDKADLLQFQVYVRQRLSELNARMPPRLATRERAELAFLEEQVVQDHMPVRKKRIRDPLRDVHEREIRHTNLPLLSRFVSEAGAILPKRLTGVSPRKQRKLTKAIKRAHVLALMPKTWKLPRYRHASYADQFSMPEKTKFERSEDDEFRDPPDIRFPNQWENTRNPLEIDLARLVRASPGLPPQGRQGRK